MPTLSIYVNDALYAHLMKYGRPSAVGKKWIDERYEKEIKK